MVYFTIKLQDGLNFEIWGPNKTRIQIATVPNSYVAMNTIEYGYGGKIPLWLFGFLY